MNRQIKSILILLIIILVLAGAYYAYNHFQNTIEIQQVLEVTTQPTAETAKTAETTKEETKENSENEQTAPDFVFYDIDGAKFSLHEFFGKPIILSFWASWCPYCKQQMPDFQEVFESYGDKVQFLMMNSSSSQRETLEKANSLITENGYTFPVFFDKDADGTMQYGVQTLPMTFIIHADGTVKSYARGAITKDILIKQIDEALALAK